MTQKPNFGEIIGEDKWKNTRTLEKVINEHQTTYEDISRY